MRLFLILAAVAPLCACAAWPTGSYVGPTSERDAAVLASAIAGYVAQSVPAGSVANVQQPAHDTTLSPLLAADLDRSGVKVGPDGVPVTYVTTALDQGALVRIMVGQAVASRYFVRNSAGSLQPGGPMMVAQP